MSGEIGNWHHRLPDADRAVAARMRMIAPILFGIETGGTEIVAQLQARDGLIARGRWPSTSPEAALSTVLDCVAESLPAGSRPAAAGIAAFGPLMVDPADRCFRQQLATSKPGWTGSIFRAALCERLGIPVAIDTDVNAAARAELALGGGRGLPSLAYLTIGTGIGAGLAIGRNTLKGPCIRRSDICAWPRARRYHAERLPLS